MKSAQLSASACAARWSITACAVRNSACVMLTGAPNRFASHAALPRWSGW